MKEEMLVWHEEPELLELLSVLHRNGAIQFPQVSRARPSDVAMLSSSMPLMLADIENDTRRDSQKNQEPLLFQKLEDRVRSCRGAVPSNITEQI
jgi:hypothetical protein